MCVHGREMCERCLCWTHPSGEIREGCLLSDARRVSLADQENVNNDGIASCVAINVHFW